MEFFDEEFSSVLELIILKRNDDGATLSEIHDDYCSLFGQTLDSIWGYKLWEEPITQLLTYTLPNVSQKALENGCIVYYMNTEAAIAKYSTATSTASNLSNIIDILEIDFKKLQEIEEAKKAEQAKLEANSQVEREKNDRKKPMKNLTASRRECAFYGHSIIGDDFFLEMAHVDLRHSKQITRNGIEKIGLCASGQTIKKAIKNVSFNTDKIRDSAIINVGSIDLVQGKEFIDMVKDIQVLAHTLLVNKVFPIFTTLAPIANRMYDNTMESKRKAFNQFLLNNFDTIDIEDCFLSNVGRIMFDLYQGDPRSVSGTRYPLVIWNHVGRQRVVKMLKRKIPEVYDEIYY